MKKKTRRFQTLGEEIGNAITHGVGFALAIAGTTLMYIVAKGAVAYIAVTIYSLGLMMLYVMSSLYHSFKEGTTVKRVFRLFDHISIFFLIGGTYAPILLIYIGGAMGWIFFGIQWVLIIIGVIFKTLLKPGRLMIISTTLYLLLGWSGLYFLPYLLKNNLPLFWFIFIGGVAYSAGVFFFASKFKYAHFVWHFFVLLGSLFHFFGIFFFIM